MSKMDSLPSLGCPDMLLLQTFPISAHGTTIYLVIWAGKLRIFFDSPLSSQSLHSVDSTFCIYLTSAEHIPSSHWHCVGHQLLYNSSGLRLELLHSPHSPTHSPRSSPSAPPRTTVIMPLSFLKPSMLLCFSDCLLLHKILLKNLLD